MTSNVFMKAILSMDAYNRSYDEGIELSNQTQIGTANISMDSSELGTSLIDGFQVRNDSIIGFFAQQYTYNGETIISYRGTDFPENSAHN